MGFGEVKFSGKAPTYRYIAAPRKLEITYETVAS